MYESNLRNWHPSTVDYNYVVYFYQSGRFEKYLPNKRLLSGAYGGASFYDFTSDLFGKKHYPMPQTVEDVIRHGYFSIPESEPEIAIISDRKNTSWLGLDDIINQIRHRYEVYQQNIYEIEVSKCSAINSFYTHEAWHGPSNSRVEYSLNKRLDKLYHDQRLERADLWKDVSRLRILLPEQAQQYLAAYRKVSILEDEKGDAS